LWTNLNVKIFDYLQSVNLAQLVAAQGAAPKPQQLDKRFKHDKFGEAVAST
jgi:DNA-binding IscR family transcriptional regulator